MNKLSFNLIIIPDQVKIKLLERSHFQLLSRKKKTFKEETTKQLLNFHAKEKFALVSII